MNIQEFKNAIFDADHTERQYRAAYQMRYVKNDPEVIHILFRACYEAKDAKLQQTSVESLGMICPDRALETFTKSTHSHNPDKRMRALYHLGTLGNPEGINVVLRGFSDPDERVRRAAAVSAGRLGRDLNVITALKNLLNGFEPERVKTAARISINMVKQRMNGIQGFNRRGSFNKPDNRNVKEQKNFNKPNHIPDAYTPKGF